MKKSTLIGCLFFIFGLVPSAYSQIPAKDCNLTLQEVEVRKVNLESMISGLESLLGSGQKMEIPLRVLFQVDLKEPAKLIQRKKELSDADSKEKLLDTADYRKFLECATEGDLKLSIEELAEKQAALNTKKIQFLNLDDEKRSALIANYEAQKQRTEAESKIESELAASQNALEKAQTDLTKSETQSSQPQDNVYEQILIARASLEKYVVDVESEQIQYIEFIRSKKNLLNELRSGLEDSAKVENVTPASISNELSAVSSYWESSVDQILELFSGFEIKSDYKIPEMLRLSDLKTDANKAAYQNYVAAYETAASRSLAISHSKSKLLNELKSQNFILLRDAGGLRSSLIRRCDKLTNCERPRGLNSKNLSNIIREIRVLPLRFAAGGLTKWLEVRAKLSSGLDGWLDLGRQVFVLFILLAIPFLLTKVLNWISRQLDVIRRNLLSKSMLDYKKRTNYAYWIARLNPFVPSVGMILSIHFARSLLETTVVKELSILLFYFELYYVYRATNLLLKIILEIVFATDSVDKLKEQKTQIEKSATRISRLIFIEYALLYLIQDTVRRALVYNLVSDIIFWINFGFLFLEARKWREEVRHSFAYRFPQIWSKIERYYRVDLGGFILPPFLFLAVVLNDFVRFIASHLIRLDIVKRLLSEVLKRQLERAEKESVTYSNPPQEYLSVFDYYLPAKDQFFINRDNSIMHEVRELTKTWLSGEKSDDLLVIIGNRGMGKTTTLDKVYQDTEASGRKVLAQVPHKTLTQESLFEWLSKVLETPLDSVAGFQAYNDSLKQPTLLFIDDIQNFFIGTIAGFDAYKIFIEIINLNTKNVFWCLTVNSRSWAYLKGVFGREHFYGRVLELSPWRDYEIQRLILARHEFTQYSRDFDKSIRAYGASDSLGQQSEAQFFRLLWGQSRGNPRSALMYWISAISSPAEQKIHVGIPTFVSSSLVSTMSDEALFLLAALARHESLTHAELRTTTGIEDTIIRKCLKEAHDKKLVWSDEAGCIRISSMAQYVIDYYLIGKNFLYE